MRELARVEAHQAWTALPEQAGTHPTWRRPERGVWDLVGATKRYGHGHWRAVPPRVIRCQGPLWPGIMGLVQAQNAEHVGPSVELPDDVVDRTRTLGLALPEVTVRVDGSRSPSRSTAYSFDIRQRSFCLLVAVADPTGKPVPLLRLRADPDEREALLSIGHPFFAPQGGRDRLGVLVTDDTDWDEIRELVTESYRILAPKKLTALLD